jgi:hypothetical protein
LIDKDVALIDTLLRGAQLEEAKHVYQQGAFSRSFALLNFGFQGLPGDFQPHSPVTGASDSGEMIKGMMLEHGKQGDKVVRILYNNGNPHSCYVGANTDPVVDGCKLLQRLEQNLLACRL